MYKVIKSVAQKFVLVGLCTIAGSSFVVGANSQNNITYYAQKTGQWSWNSTKKLAFLVVKGVKGTGQWSWDKTKKMAGVGGKGLKLCIGPAMMAGGAGLFDYACLFRSFVSSNNDKLGQYHMNKMSFFRAMQVIGPFIGLYGAIICLPMIYDIIHNILQEKKSNCAEATE